MFRVEVIDNDLTVYLNNRPVIFHSMFNPFLSVSVSENRYNARTGVWNGGLLNKYYPLTFAKYDEERSLIRFYSNRCSISAQLAEESGALVVTFSRVSSQIKKLLIHLPAAPDDAVYGAGERRPYFNLRGGRYSMWVKDRHISRTRAHLMARLGDVFSNTHDSRFPIPVYVTQGGEFCYADMKCYGIFDFNNKMNHIIEAWGIPDKLVLGAEDGLERAAAKLSSFIGRQPPIPSWAAEGALIGVSGGSDAMLDRLKTLVDSGVKFSALVIHDWCGVRETRYSSPLFWDWDISPELYPGLAGMLPKLLRRGIRALAYINPHFAIEGKLFAEASGEGFLLKTESGANNLTDMGGFMAGHLDLTNPSACAWFKDKIIKNILERGFSGYLADMGEFLPYDAKLFGGQHPRDMHNLWPALWGKLNRDIMAAWKKPDTLYITRSGYASSLPSCPLTWSSGRHTDYSAMNGLASAITSSLTLGTSGVGVSSSEIGGNISLFAGSRTKDLFMRWTEFSAFSPVMRTVPGDSARNWQFESDQDTVKHFSLMTAVHWELAPYIKTCLHENSVSGKPVMRPLAMEAPGDNEFKSLSSQYMLGSDLLVAPVLRPMQSAWRVLLPDGEWVHLWSGKTYSGESCVVDCPYGRPPVFYRSGSVHAPVFEELRALPDAEISEGGVT